MHIFYKGGYFMCIYSIMMDILCVYLYNDVLLPEVINDNNVALNLWEGGSYGQFIKKNKQTEKN